jgi:hypothetical protein
MSYDAALIGAVFENSESEEIFNQSFPQLYSKLFSIIPIEYRSDFTFKKKLVSEIIGIFYDNSIFSKEFLNFSLKYLETLKEDELVGFK